MEKLRLKRHGSFSIREGWFEKTIYAIEKHGKATFSKDDGVAILGVGSNMVSSIKYWMIACGLIDDKNHELTELGELISKYDPYLDNLFSWWMIHQHLVSDKENAPIFNIVFNGFNIKNFDKNMVTNYVLNYMEDNDCDMSNSNQVDGDVAVFLRTYISEKVTNPEDNLNSPLGELGLIKKGTNGLYVFSQPSLEKLPYQVVYYSLLNCLKNNEDKNEINIDDLFIDVLNSPSKVFRMDKNLLYMYLNEMKNANLVTINRTAGLNMLYLQRTLSLKEIFDDFFMGVE